MLLNTCATWRGSFQKKQKKQFITVCYSTCVHIEMKQGAVFEKNPIDDDMLLNSCAKWNKWGSFQKTTIYYSMLFNLCVYWNETRGQFSKKQQFITVCYSTCVRIEMKQWDMCDMKSKQVCFSTCVHIEMKQEYATCVVQKNHIEMKQEGLFSKNNKKNNLLQYAIQLVCIEMKQEGQFSKKKNPIDDNNVITRGSFQKTTIYYSMLFNSCAYWNKTREAVFKKIQLMTILTIFYWTHVRHEGAVFKKIKTIYYSMLFNLCGAYWNETIGTVFKKLQKNTIYYSMLFNLCAYWNETRGTVFKKQQFITVCCSTCVHIEMKQRGAVFKKQQFITVCYSTCVHSEMKQEGKFSKNTNLLQYAVQLVCILKWNKRGSFQKTTIYYSMLFNLCA